MRLASFRWLAPMLLVFAVACSSASDPGRREDGGFDARSDAAADAGKDAVSDKASTGGAPGIDAASSDGGGSDAAAGHVAGGGGGATGGATGGGAVGGRDGGVAGSTGGTLTGSGGAPGTAGMPAGGKGGSAGRGGTAGQSAGGQGGGPIVPTCQDRTKNGDETDVDCGGHCGPCGPNKSCRAGTDCSLGVCSSNGTCASCVAAADCAGQDLECAHRTCTDGVCGTAFVAAGTTLADQIKGDCKVRKCGANGTVTDNVDATDKPDDANPCTADTCVGMTQVFAPLAAGSSCGASGSNMVCDNAAHCVGCLVASTCPGTDTACRTRTCINHVCGFDLKPTGTKLPDPTAGDCKSLVCDDKGDPQAASLDTDLPVDGNPCTTDVCSNGTPSHAPIDSGTDCGQGKICDGANHCVECLSAAGCAGADTECKTRTCVNGVCGTSFAAANKVLAAQAPGDCKLSVCDGQGNITVSAASDDVPQDNNPCTTDLCSGLTPVNSPVTQGTSCGVASVCDDMGHCVGCNGPADCGVDTECAVYSCTNHVCGVMYFPGTPSATQVAGDCHQRVCDGTGQIQNAVDPTDNGDGNVCTDDSCVDGTPQHLPTAARTPCTGPGNATMCNGDGASPACVACVGDSDCPGTVNDCQHPACNSGVCGTFLVPANTPAATQVAADCHLAVCDGNGNVLNNVDDSDVPATDNNACTTEACNAGVPAHTPTPGQACSQNGGSVCDNETVPQCSPVVWAVRVDNGTTALSSGATPVFIDRIAVLDGSAVGTPIAMPVAASGSNQPLVLSGTASSDGALALSADGHYVSLAGYNATIPTTSVANGTGPRGAALISAAGAVDTSTVFTGKFAANNVRSAVSSDGSLLWAAGAGGATAGVYLTTKGATTTPTQVTAQNTRVCQIWLGQMYCSWSASSLASFDALGTPGALPTSMTTALPVSGATTNSSSPFGFALFDTNNDSKPDVLYLVDDRTSANGGIWRFKITTFDPTGTPPAITVVKETAAIGALPADLPMGTAQPAFRGLTGYVDTTGKIVLIATAAASANNVSYIIKYVDDPNLPLTSSASVPGTLLKSTGVPTKDTFTNAIYRGISLAPR